ncbi:hypothetical protein MPSEU_000525200 [Mayamaea pseudoterrestris]|nr:hypothetical protein MPSEU_000525200 [Mayamaea pseudoterrestris]
MTQPLAAQTTFVCIGTATGSSSNGLAIGQYPNNSRATREVRRFDTDRPVNQPRVFVRRAHRSNEHNIQTSRSVDQRLKPPMAANLEDSKGTDLSNLYRANS